jgi:hypothetical protein
LFTTVFKRLTEGRHKGFDGGLLIDWQAACENDSAAAAGCCVSPPEQFSALRTLFISFRKAMLKKAKKNMGQYKSEGQDFKRD